MFCSAGFGTKLLLLLAFISTISAAYTTYVEDYHTSTGTLYGFSAMPRGRAGSSDFPARPETQEALASALESTNPMRTDDATASMYRATEANLFGRRVVDSRTEHGVLTQDASGDYFESHTPTPDICCKLLFTLTMSVL